MKRKLSLALVAGLWVGSALALLGCTPRNTTTYETQPALAAAPSADCTGCGTITSIDSTDGMYGGNEYRVSIRLDNGGTQAITQSTQPPFRVGDRVQILTQPVR